MQKIIIILISALCLASSNLFAKPKPLAPKESLEILETCTKINYKETIIKFDRAILNYFAEKSTAEIVAIYNKDDVNAESLRVFAPYLLPGNILAEADKECWTHYKDLTDAIRESRFEQTKSNLASWHACLATKFRKPFQTVQLVTKCVEIGVK